MKTFKTILAVLCIATFLFACEADSLELTDSESANYTLNLGLSETPNQVADQEGNDQQDPANGGSEDEDDMPDPNESDSEDEDDMPDPNGADSEDEDDMPDPNGADSEDEDDMPDPNS